MKRKRAAALAVVAALAGAVLGAVYVLGDDNASSAAGTYYLSPSGNDANSCTAAAPCRSLERGYEAASLGDIVELAAGRYGAQTIPASVSKGQPDIDRPDITFRPSAGANAQFSEVRLLAPHIRLEGVEVNGMLTARYRPEQPSFEGSGDVHFHRVRVVDGGRILFSAVKNFSVTDSLIANNWRDGIDIYGSASGAGEAGHSPQNGLIEGNEIRDLRLIDNDHIDGIQFTTGVNVVIRNNKIGPRIHHQGLLAKTDKGPVTGITIEGNEFFDVVQPGFSLMFSIHNGRRCHDIEIVGNTFRRPPTPRSDSAEQCTGVMTGNTFSSMSSFSCSQWLESFTLTDNTFLSGEPCESRPAAAGK